ncbi:hypothetical protein [Intestinimonas massiliensis (ex Afouda et al. 2020)]|uniref:hypothetical protein n=1 Tax=Intestinimonas massiliensis (ex Afouda et al. 2020) TaxID=1673721 RepID=UPI0013EF0F98|nr:hypothetical protein [Intestinimonas massiliensis (ex Afouda et al. 2020)]
MSRKVLVIATSPRKGCNSDRLADEFAGGVTSVGEIQGHSALKQDFEMGKNV